MSCVGVIGFHTRPEDGKCQMAGPGLRQFGGPVGRRRTGLRRARGVRRRAGRPHLVHHRRRTEAARLTAAGGPQPHPAGRRLPSRGRRRAAPVAARGGRGRGHRHCRSARRIRHHPRGVRPRRTRRHPPDGVGRARRTELATARCARSSSSRPFSVATISCCSARFGSRIRRDPRDSDRSNGAVRLVADTSVLEMPWKEGGDPETEPERIRWHLDTPCRPSIEPATARASMIPCCRAAVRS